MKYMYGMRLRGFSPGCQPSGVINRLDDPTRKYWDILVYERKLTEQEIKNYDLDELGTAKAK